MGYLLTMLEEGTLEAVVRETLECRLQLQAGVRDVLNRALDTHVRVDGFRSACSAPSSIILRQVCGLVQSTPPLAAPILRAWYETHHELRSAVAALLQEREILVRASHSLTEPLQVVFGGSPVAQALPDCAESLPEYDQDKVALMLQLLAGKALGKGSEAPKTGPADPGPVDIHDDPVNGHRINADPVDGDPVNDDPVVSQVLQTALELLAQMPPTAPEWEAVIPGFSDSLVNLIAAKQAEREAAGNLGELLAAIQEEHAGLLDFFQCDTGNWQLEAGEPGSPFLQIQEHASRFKELLDEYAPLHDRAPIAAEEMARAKRRMELLPIILEANGAMQRMFNGVDTIVLGEDQQSEDDSEPVCSGASITGGGTALTSLAGGAIDPVVPFGAISQCDITNHLLLRLQYQELEQDNDDLEHENESLKAQVKELEQQLYKTRTHQESLRWAMAYRDNPEETEELNDLVNVGAAVVLAMERYPGQLLFQLNSDSDAGDSAFKWPNQVWNALRWLATDYFSSHLGGHPIPNIDEACRQACGMWYKTSQHENTMTQFRESYTTQVDGRLIWLGEHIGKGNSFDPRRTIRIAFDWDRHLQKVVVGYIGRHQRTNAS